METITLNVGQILCALVAAMGIPGTVFGFLIWNFQRQITNRDKQREKEEEAARKRAEEKERDREQLELFPSTVGQYTGLTDKNGTKVFEGDIVKTDKFSEPNKQYIIKYDLQFGAFIGQDRYNCYFVTFDGDSDEFEVIGNIHDNPELLEGGEKECPT